MNDDSGIREPDPGFRVDDSDDIGLESEVARWIQSYALVPSEHRDRTVAAILGEANRLLHSLRAYSAARRAECGTRLRVLTEQMPAILWTTDGELRVTSFLGGGLSAVGVEPMESISWPLTEVLGTDDPESPAMGAHVRALQGGSSVYGYEWHNRSYLANVEPLRDPNGAVIGAIGAAVDVTERVQAERERTECRERQARLDGMLFAARQLASQATDNLATSSGAIDRLSPQLNLPEPLRDAIGAVTAGLSEATRAIAELQRLMQPVMAEQAATPPVDDRRPSSGA